MSLKGVVKMMILSRGLNQERAAHMAGWKSQAGLSTAIGRKSPSVQSLLRICDALGYDVVVRDRNSDAEWVLSSTEEDSCEEGSEDGSAIKCDLPS